MVQTKGDLRGCMAPGGPLLQGEKVVADVQREQICAESDLWLTTAMASARIVHPSCWPKNGEISEARTWFSLPFPFWYPTGTSQPSDVTSYGDISELCTQTSRVKMGEDWSWKGKGKVTGLWFLSNSSLHTHHPLGSVLDPFFTLLLWHTHPCPGLRRKRHTLTYPRPEIEIRFESLSQSIPKLLVWVWSQSDCRYLCSVCCPERLWG